MQIMKNELRNLLLVMPSHFRISLMAFSDVDTKWKNGALTELNDANRASALAFVNSLLHGGGGTNPWGALDAAFGNSNARAIYFMTNSIPSTWKQKSAELTAEHYINTNNNRENKLTVNTISVDLNSPWLKLISDGASGTYKVVGNINSGS
jgi:hypothetical protein